MRCFLLISLTVVGVALCAPHPVPPRGFNPCNNLNCVMSSLGEEELKSIALAIADNGMLAAGYNFFNLDDGWASHRAPNGTIVAQQPAFPSGSLQPLASFLNALGLKLGVYTDRGVSTCEGRPGSKGFEALDASTYVQWGIRYVKSDSCSSAQDFPTVAAEYELMAEALAATGEDVFFSLCGWSDWFAAYEPSLGDSWRIGTDVPTWERFMQNLGAAAAVAPFAGPSPTGPRRGWPDVDMIGGRWPAQQEQFHLCLIAVIGSPLLLSFDPRDPSATSTLGLPPYLNAELLSIHQDDARGSVAARGQYYARIAGGETTGPTALRVVPSPCNASASLWTFVPAAAPAGFGQLRSVGLEGYCLALWDTWTGACIDAIYAQALPCGGGGGGGSGGCPLAAQLWAPGGEAEGWPLRSALNYSGQTPFPGPYLTASGVPGGLYAQPRFPGTSGGGAGGAASSAAAAGQAWVTTLPPGASAPVNTTVMLQGGGQGACLAPAPQASFNVWARWLANGDVALLLVNFAPQPASVVCDAACMGAVGGGGSTPQPPPGSTWKARDVWARAPAPDVPVAGFTTPLLPANGGSLLLRLSASAV